METEKWATVRMDAKLLEEQNFGFCKEIDIGVVQANRSWSHSCWACYCSAPQDETTRTTHRIGESQSSIRSWAGIRQTQH